MVKPNQCTWRALFHQTAVCIAYHDLDEICVWLDDSIKAAGTEDLW